MPTARELLEQADALMRRNRQDAAQGLRGSSARPPAAQPAGAEGTGARPAPQVVSAGGPIGAPVAADEDIPVLDRIVADARPALPAPGADDEFPVLTDAVDEIDVALPAPIDGEPSDWLVGPADDQSVLGPSPPSVALVPAVEARASPATPAAGFAPPAHPVSVPVVSHAAPAMPELEDFDIESPATDEPPITIVRAPDGTPPAALTPPPPASWIEELVAEVPSASDRKRPDDAPPPRPADAHRPPPSPSPASVEIPPVAVTIVPPPAAAVPAPVGPPRDQSWEALAEEIRMQVLQRIDLFTDTGLRDRLGERLKPIVDRASADLVATINQHVGELLRAYVAEAIEREIDRWRAGR